MSRLVEGNGVVVTGGASVRPAAKTAALPAAATPAGLYDPLNERDACGVGFIVNLHNRKSHRIIQDGLRIVENLTHRGAVGADPKMGDGAGMLVQIPHKFFASRGQAAGLRPARPGRVRGRPHLHAAGRRPARRHGEDRRPGHRRRGPGAARLARRAGRQQRAVARPRDRHHRAQSPPGVHRPRRRRHRRRRFRAQALHRAQGHLGAHLREVCRPARTTSTSSRCRAGRWSTRACSSPTSSAPITATCTTRNSSRRWRSSTSASRPTPSRPGGWRTPIASSATTARSTRCAATSTGWRRARRPPPRRCSATTSPSCGRSPTRASRTPPASTTRSSSSCAAAIRCPTRR